MINYCLRCLSPYFCRCINPILPGRPVPEDGDTLRSDLAREACRDPGVLHAMQGFEYGRTGCGRCAPCLARRGGR